MRRVIGPILTTGVSLVTAGVVVANPIVAPRADVAIPAVQLSAGNAETIGMLDQAFLDAIAPGPGGSSNPFSVLKDLISGLAADATSLGKDAIVDAFVAGVAAVSPPELTAASSPYLSYAGAPVPGFPAITDPHDLSALVPAISDVAVTVSDSREFVANDVVPVVRELVTSLAADVEYVGTGLIEAAFAVGALVADEPILIARTLTALVNGDFEGALINAVKAVVAPLGPPAMVYNTLRTVVVKYLSAPRNPAAPASAPAPEPGTRPAPLPTAPGPGESEPGESGPGESGPGTSGPGTSGPGTSGPGTSGPGESSPSTADASSRTARDSRHRNPVPDSTPAGIDAIRPDTGLAGAARKAAGAVRDAISAVGEQVAGPSSGGTGESAPALTDPPGAGGAAEQAAPAVSDEPAKPAGRAQAARHRG